MMAKVVPPFAELLQECTQSAVHLEMRDEYAIGAEAADLAAWRTSGRWDNPEYWQPWIDLVSAAVARGVVVRRARIVSEPATEYIRFEYAGTHNNIKAGELVRWLPRRQATDIPLPGNDFWVLDGKLARIHHFSGDGTTFEDELRDDPATVQLCASAFERVWERAIPHEQYRIR